MREGSYNDIERGMPVVGPDGQQPEGRVADVLVDQSSNIFIGLVLMEGTLLHEHRLFVPGEHVVAVHNSHVQIDLSLDQLQPYVSPAEKMAHTKEQYAHPAPLDDVLL